MAPSIKVTYNPVNESNTFTGGDIVSGQVILTLAKDCQIQSLSIKFKGEAEVDWSERRNERTIHFHAEDKYFNVKNFFIASKDLKKGQKMLTMANGEAYCNVVAPGTHVYPFIFQIPQQDMPSSFKSSIGKITYTLEAKLSRSMRLPTRGSETINFVSKVDLSSNTEAMQPIHEHTDKKMNMFSKGSVSMDVNLEKAAFVAGGGIKVVASIENKSSRKIKPKFCVYRMYSFFANAERNIEAKDILKEVGEPIPPSARENVTRTLTIPQDVQPSIHNCSIIKVEYRLRVSLDVKYGTDPEVEIPIMLLSASQASAVAPPPASDFGYGFETFGNPNPPVWGFGPAQPPTAPQPGGHQPAYGAYGTYPDYGNRFQ